jgi:two-component system chemotaxis response regulator CheY
MTVPFAYLKVNCLVVDDEASMRQTIKNMMTRIGFKSVVSAENGKKAYEILSASRMDLVICDVNMPEMTGLELFKTIRADRKYDQVQFIFVTAEARRDMVARVAEGGTNEYIIKPFVMGTLEDKIAKVLAKKFDPSVLDIHLKDFKKFMEQKDIENAEVELKKADAISPDNVGIIFGFGQIAMARGDVDSALKFFMETIDKKPLFVKGYNAIGGIYESLGDIGNAIKYYELAHNISPANTERLISLSKLYNKAGETDKAEILLKDAQSDVREDASTSGHLLGEMYLSKNENQKALDVLLKVSKKNPSDISIKQSLAEAYRRLNQPEEAVNIYRSIISTSPDNAMIYYNMGKAYLEMGNKHNAVNAIKKAWELDPFSKEIISDLKALAEKDKVAL